MLKYKLSQNFKGKRVLITGHTGFKGAWLALLMLNLGAKVMDLVWKKNKTLVI